MKNKIFLLSAMLLATAPLASCNKSTVTLVLNSGMGVFADGTTTKILTVAKGTNFSTLNVEAPTYTGYATYTWEDPNGQLIRNVNDLGDDSVDEYHVYIDLTLVANFFEDISAMRGISTGTVAGAMMDAIARQPEAEETIKKNFSICVNAMTMANDPHDVMAIGDIGKDLMDAVARQPEASGKLRDISMYCYERIIKLATKDGRCEAMGRIGAKAMDAIARQPEATSKIFEALRIAYTGIEVTANAAKAHGIGDAGASAMDAIARQPEASGKIIEALCLTIEYINNN